MNFNLAKQLIAAEFPYEFEGGLDFSQKPPLYVFTKFPTLSELIEACGDNFATLIKVKNLWQATQSYEDGHVYKIQEFFWYDAPEEAVANLWLQIRKRP